MKCRSSRDFKEIEAADLHKRVMDLYGRSSRDFKEIEAVLTLAWLVVFFPSQLP